MSACSISRRQGRAGSPAPGESQSNGTIEEAGKTTRECVRLLQYQVEHYTGISLDGTEDFAQWAIRWEAMSYSRYAMGRDGLTAYERRRGRRCRIPLVRFGGAERRGTISRDKAIAREGSWTAHGPRASGLDTRGRPTSISSARRMAFSARTPSSARASTPCGTGTW